MTFLPLSELSAQDLFKLLRLRSGHPDSEGYPYNRGEMLSECNRRGKQLLEALDWPTDLDTPYYLRYCPDHEPQRLRDLLWNWRLDNLKTVMHDAERVLVAKGVLPDWVGLSCWGIKEFKAAVSSHPELIEEFKEAVRLNKGFYERYHEGTSLGLVPIAKMPKECECERNVAQMAKFLGLNVDVVESLESLPKPNEYAGVWHVIEYFTPLAPSANVLRVVKAKREFEDLKQKAHRKHEKSVQAPLACFGVEAVV
jgi:hypothetical protein